MTEQWYLGRSVYDPRPTRLHTRIQPRAFSRDGAWRSYDKWVENFPTEGKVFSPNHPQGAGDALFAFDVTEVSDPTKQDRFRLQTLRRVEEVLDYSDRDPDDVRRLFVEHGITGRKADRETVIVLLPNDLCVRISLVRGGDGKKSVAELIDLAQLPLYSFDRSLFAGEKIEGCWYSIPDVTVGPEQGAIEWSLDKDFLASLLRRLKRLSLPGAGEAPYPATRSQIQSFITGLDRHGLLPAAAESWRSDAARVRRLASDMNLELDQIEELVQILCSFAPIEKKLSEAMEARRRTLEVELVASVEAGVRSEVESRFASLSLRNAELDETLSKLDGEKSGLEQAVAELSDRRDRTRREIISLTANVTSVLKSRDDEQESQTRSLIQDIEKVLHGEKPRYSRVKQGPPLSELPFFDYDMTPSTWDSLNAELVAAASRHGFEPRDIETLDLLVRAGEVLLLSSDVAGAIIRCYASVVAQGGFAVQSLDPSTIGYDDLWRSPVREAPTTLSRAWAECANDRSVPRLVLLEGIEKTPLDLWIRPFLETLRSPERPNNLLVFMSMASAPIDRDRSVGNLSELVVPFKTHRPTPLNPEFLRSLLRVNEDPGRWFDFGSKGAIPVDEIETLLNSDFGTSGKDRITLALRTSLEARGTGIADIAKTVRALCENLDGSVASPNDRIDGLQIGREYLRTLSN